MMIRFMVSVLYEGSVADAGTILASDPERFPFPAIRLPGRATEPRASDTALLEMKKPAEAGYFQKEWQGFLATRTSRFRAVEDAETCYALASGRR